MRGKNHYVTFHLPQHWLAAMLRRHPDFLETFERLLTENPRIANEPCENYKINAIIAVCDFEQALTEVGEKLVEKYHMEEPWQTIYVGPAKLDCILIRPEIHSTDEILKKNPYCFLEMMEGMVGVPGVVSVSRNGNDIAVTIFEGKETNVLEFIEEHMEQACETDDPYHVLDVSAVEERTARRIEKYIEKYNEKLVDQLFAELERRLEEK